MPASRQMRARILRSSSVLSGVPRVLVQSRWWFAAPRIATERLMERIYELEADLAGK